MQSTTELPQYSSHPFNEYESPFQYPRSPPQPHSYGYAPVQESAMMMPEPEAQVFTSEEATHGPNPNPMPAGIQLYDAPYTQPDDPFGDHDRMPIQRLNSDVEGQGLLRPATALSGSTHAPSGATPSVNGDDDFDEVRRLNAVIAAINNALHRTQPSAMAVYHSACQGDTRPLSASSCRTVTLSSIVPCRRVCWTCAITGKETSSRICATQLLPVTLATLTLNATRSDSSCTIHQDVLRS